MQVQKFETDHEKFSDWLNDKKRDISAFGPIPATPDEVEKELRKLQVCMQLEAHTQAFSLHILAFMPLVKLYVQ